MELATKHAIMNIAKVLMHELKLDLDIATHQATQLVATFTESGEITEADVNEIYQALAYY